MKMAALQLCSQDDVELNLRQAEHWVSAAARAGAQLVVLPEGFAFLGAEEDKRHHVERLDGTGPILSTLRRWARTHGVHLIGGGLPERSADDRPPYNTSVLLDPEGQLVAHYRKMHLFDVELRDGTRLFESKATLRGEQPVVATVDGVGVGLAICYDVRFPEHFAWQRANGARVLTVPAAFTRTTGEAHWHVLLRARAVETQCYVVAAAQQGHHPHGRQTFGHALIVDPWGSIVSEVSEPGPGMALADFDVNLIDDVRARMPIFKHKHPHFPR